MIWMDYEIFLIQNLIILKIIKYYQLIQSLVDYGNQQQYHQMTHCLSAAEMVEVLPNNKYYKEFGGCQPKVISNLNDSSGRTKLW